MLDHDGHVNAEAYTFLRPRVCMNASPSMIIALLRQFTNVGVRQADSSWTAAVNSTGQVATFAFMLHDSFARTPAPALRNSPRPSGTTVGRDDQNRALRFAQDALADASDHHLIEGPMSVRSQDNEVRLQPVRFREDC
jgi:hypothetical protein